MTADDKAINSKSPPPIAIHSRKLIKYCYVPIFVKPDDSNLLAKMLMLPEMSKFDKIRSKILDGKSDANIGFEDLRNFLLSLGFVERIKGSHHSYRRERIDEKPNLQRDGNKAKSYQVRQIREILKKYDL